MNRNIKLFLTSLIFLTTTSATNNVVTIGEGTLEIIITGKQL